MASTASPIQALLSGPHSTFVSQGAEAKVYKSLLAATDFPTLLLRLEADNGENNVPIKLSKSDLKQARSVLGPSGLPSAESGERVPVFLKHRFTKGYRHPSLDGSLTKARVAGEAKAILKCSRAGVNVPGLRLIDAPAGILGLEWIEGNSVRRLLPDDSPEEDEHQLASETALQPTLSLEDYGLSIPGLMALIGAEIAKMHLADVIHGDLTTSNMMLRKHAGSTTSKPAQLILIDFGLSYVSGLVEDKAVDLYVLERAFASTHPEPENEIFDKDFNPEEANEEISPAVKSTLFTTMLAAYEKKVGEKQWAAIGKRLDDVRLRGRKRSMVG
ncbi:hypothetical protein BDV98DRAFT_606953 [Pterulicium gracile]|uniref:non-specific serine/threonine protein kinase n=1 Tax=Pterulicium gracile TaxID=1884261 RepID=A0A5C3Q8I3_9AGAR|nr:hypothetical protein BDV98DRAFT_606953 [Pterula gracilis]